MRILLPRALLLLWAPIATPITAAARLLSVAIPSLAIVAAALAA